VDDSRYITQNREEDVDKKIGITPALEEDTQRGEQHGCDDFDNVASGERHFERFDVSV